MLRIGHIGHKTLNRYDRRSGDIFDLSWERGCDGVLWFAFLLLRYLLMMRFMCGIVTCMFVFDYLVY